MTGKLAFSCVFLALGADTRQTGHVRLGWNELHGAVDQERL
jgi:hypothetical protein